MAITSVLGGQGRISDATLTAMLNSGDQNLVDRANDYIEGARKEAEELGKNKGVLGLISDLFGFSKLAAAEPNMPSKQKFSQQSPTREFGIIRAGQPELGIKGAPAVQDLPVDFSELDDLEAQDAEYLDLIQKAREAESPGILENIINNTLIGRGLDFLQDQFQYRPADASITSTPLAQFAFRNQLARDPSFNIAAALDKQNALGGYYSDFARGQRQLAGRFSNLLDRARSGKTFSERNLLGISRALGTPLTRDDIGNITQGDYNITPGTFTAESLSKGFDSEEFGPTSSPTTEGRAAESYMDL